HADQVVGATRNEVADRHARALAAGWREHDVLPVGIGVPVVPGRILVDHGAGRGMARDIVDQALSENEHAAAVAQLLPVFVARPHGRSPASARRADWIACQTRSLVAGMSSSRTPQGASAFMMA